MNADSDTRRSFVKKSLAVGIAAAQPAFLAGLVRADGGGDSFATTSKPETTDPNTTIPESTIPYYETTIPYDTTVYTTSPYHY